jgi:hypothetical protein
MFAPHYFNWSGWCDLPGVAFTEATEAFQMRRKTPVTSQGIPLYRVGGTRYSTLAAFLPSAFFAGAMTARQSRVGALNRQGRPGTA